MSEVESQIGWQVGLGTIRWDGMMGDGWSRLGSWILRDDFVDVTEPGVDDDGAAVHASGEGRFCAGVRGSAGAGMPRGGTILITVSRGE